MKTGKPAMLLEKRCKVCSLASSKKVVYNKIHNLRFKKNFTLQRIVDHITEILWKDGYSSKQIPSIKNLSIHFNKHIPVELLAQYKIQVVTKSTKKETKKSLVPTDSATEIMAIVAEKESVYTRMEDVYILVKQQLDNLVLLGDTPVGDTSKLSSDYYKSLTALVREMRGTLTDIEDIKNNEMLMRIVVGTVLQSFTEGILQSVLGELSEFRKTLSFYLKDKNTINSICAPLEQSVGRHVLECSSKALETVVKKYKIK